MDKELLALAAALGARLKERKETIAIAESSAGGLISAALLAVACSPAYFLGGGIIYTQAARRGLLQVADDAMKGVRSSTEAYALIKARTIRERLGATWGLSETGARGPTGNRYGDAAGHACFAVAGPLERATTLETGRGGRGAAGAPGPPPDGPRRPREEHGRVREGRAHAPGAGAALIPSCFIFTWSVLKSVFSRRAASLLLPRAVR